MPDGESSVVVAGGQASMEPSLSVSNQLQSLSLSQDKNHDDSVKKDPRKIARKYQLELCKKAMEENIIVYLGTGCGKTHIAVLLMYGMGHLIRKPQKNICVFLAPTVALVHQQAKVIADSTNFKVGTYCGSSKRLKRHQDWEQEIGQYEVLVMTPQILLHNLSHCFITMEMIALLIFDECHHAQVKSNHAYAVIMKVFYKSNSSKVPRIFGMTASPVVGKGASSEANLAKSINSLEHILDAKVYSVEDKELQSFVTTPVINIYHYVSTASGETSLYLKIEEIKRQCIANLGRSIEDHQKRMNAKKLLNRMHDNVIFGLQNLGIWGALQASHILLSGDRSERHELVEAEGNSSDDSLCDKYLAQAAELFTSQCMIGDRVTDLSSVEILKEPFFSAKLLRLIGILSNFRLQKNMKCIIFVNRIVTARSLSYILQKLKLLRQWRSDFLVGVHAGLKSMSRKTMNIIVDKFRSGELNLLVATKVGEEGLDIQTCCLVIRFDLPETVASFIQSRGRARMPQSEYAFLVDSGNKKEIDVIDGFKEDEYRMNMEVTFRTSKETYIIPEERIFRIDSSGASVSSGYSISLLHQYCSKLPHDEYFDPKPSFHYLDDSGGISCHITLPSNAPINQILGTPQLSMEASKREACLKAIEELYNLGALSDCLLPKQDDAEPEVQVSGSSDEDECEDAISRGKLHEMLVPSAFGQSWINEDNIVRLNSYYIKFCPYPEDRVYKEFGLFMMTCLPMEAEKLELDLHLAHGRSVMTMFVPFGVVEFNKDEIKMAENFQEMFLKIILDRLEFISEFVDLGMSAESHSGTSTFYLLLPVVLQEYGNAMEVDWKIVKRCLCSPIFRHPADTMDKKVFPLDIHLQLANGYRSVRNVENSLVYAPHKKNFYFVTNVNYEKNGYSPHNDSGTSSYVDYFIEKFSIHLKCPKQPLLHVKPVSNLHNLLHNRKREDAEPQELDEYLIYLPPELCELKVIGFSKDIGSSISLLPSIMHRLGNLLVAIELKHMLSSSFPEAAEISAIRVLEALTTEKCQERFSLERLEVLGDAFLKFAVARHFFLMHDSLHEGDLTKRRSNAVNNSNLFKLAIKRNLQVYICDQTFDPTQFYALGRPCPRVCSNETEESIHFCLNSVMQQGKATETRCSKNHHWLHRKTIADVVEALVGAFLVDSGFKAAIAFLSWIGIQVDFEASQVVDICIASASYSPLSSEVDIPSLEGKLGHHFFHKGLLLQAFVHPSYNKLGGGCYQRLEFLGDAVLDYLITSYLFSAYPKLKPGQLTDLRSLSVNNKAFACLAVDRSFDNFLLCDSSGLSEAIKKYVDYVRRPVSDNGIKEGPKCPKALGDLVESCVGAILLDSGFNLNKVWKIMTSFLDPIMKFSSSLQLSPVRDLRELCQSHNLELEFLPVPSKLTKRFSVEAKVSGNGVCETASATGQNKKEACRIASQLLFLKFKAQGWKAKSKTLEEVLESTSKMEPKLIGYDETPIDVTDTNTAKHIVVNADPYNNSNPEICPMQLTDEICSPCVKPFGQRLQSSAKGKLSQIFENRDCGSDSSGTGTARSRLYELCAAYCWKPPSFECCKKEGPDHLKQFTCKVTLEIEEAQNLILEFVGEPLSKKKDAAESAAEGALWYLQHEGFLPSIGWDEGAVYYSDQALAGDDGSGARGEAGTDSNHSLIQKFKEFIRNFETTNNVLPYRESLLHNPKFLLVDMGDLDTFDSDLPDKLRSNPADVLPLFEAAAAQVLVNLKTKVAGDTGDMEDQTPGDVQILLTSKEDPVSMRSLGAQYISKLVKIAGITIAASRTKAKATYVTLICKNCKKGKQVPCRPGLGGAIVPRSCDHVPQPGEEPCPIDPWLVVPDKSRYVDQQTLKMQENPEDVPTGELPRNLLLSVDRHLVQTVVPGSRLTIMGIFSIYQASNSNTSHKGAVAIRQPYIRVVGIEETNETNSRGPAAFTQDEIEEFKKFASEPDAYKNICSMIAPSIFGHEEVKKAVACLLFGGSRKNLPDGVRLRGDINVLLLGDPSTAKSQFLKFVEKTAPIAVYTSGKGSSAAGLTASVIQDSGTREFYLEGGAMVLADGGVVCIDEFDKMRPEDRVAIHEAMEQQTISIAKAGITTVLNSRTSVLAAANPPSGRYDDLKTAQDNIDLQTTILSRFDLIFIVKDVRMYSQDKIIANHIIKVHKSAGGRMGESRTFKEENWLKRYLQYCRTQCHPRLSESATTLLQNHYVKIRQDMRQQANETGEAAAIPITVRQLEAIVRLSEALAKMKLSHLATEENVQEAVRLFTVSTMDAAKSGINQQINLTPDMANEIKQAETQIKRRIGIGNHISERRLIDDLSRMGMNESIVRRALIIMHQRDEIEYKRERRVVFRKA